MRIAGLLIGVGLLSCATMGSKDAPAAAAPATPATAKQAPAKDVKAGRNGQRQVVVIGKAQNTIPGLRSTEQETEFTIFHGQPYRCTRVKGSPEKPKGVESCRKLNSGMQGNPHTGLIDRYSSNIDSSDRH